MNLKKDANVAKLNALAGSLKSAVSMVHAKHLIRHESCGSDAKGSSLGEGSGLDCINVDGKQVAMYNSYPAAVSVIHYSIFLISMLTNRIIIQPNHLKTKKLKMVLIGIKIGARSYKRRDLSLAIMIIAFAMFL